ncbi:hypothetical protein H4CHR_04537 [Variovorax sp. PBS-H4]|uniref:hypothetical protein n=1 Tax=Variovorax sp. PBS-H4 TaxID=434008 RepID=UPI001316275F|nr:hypothetical protein [Variovorax sp. PBS-H4]VTU38873.1 hypothetical protein H4CHR_04537 [Variovorax sp. PBS-H4]
MNTRHTPGTAEGETADRATSKEGSPKPGRSAAAGETRWAQASGDGLQKPVPQQPNELDESASSQSAGNPSMESVGAIAHHDAVHGADTDRGPVMDAVYNGPVTEGNRTGDDEEARGQRDPSKSTSSSKR